jgi:hypothetical protein
LFNVTWPDFSPPLLFSPCTPPCVRMRKLFFPPSHPTRTETVRVLSEVHDTHGRPTRPQQQASKQARKQKVQRPQEQRPARGLPNHHRLRPVSTPTGKQIQHRLNYIQRLDSFGTNTVSFATREDGAGHVYHQKKTRIKTNNNNIGDISLGASWTSLVYRS